MNQVESVAFWFGFTSSIVGIVLSVVAIVFSILVDRRSGAVSDRTIQSLQKIESAVERSSSDTRELIKAAWDKMLGGVDRTPPAIGEPSAKVIAAGIAAELRSEIQALKGDQGTLGGQSDQRIDQMGKYIESLEASIRAQLNAASTSARPSARFQATLELIRGLSDQAYVLLRELEPRHLTQAQYRSLVGSTIGDSLAELRDRGLLAPVMGKNNGKRELCYYYPPGSAETMRAVFEISPSPAKEVTNEVVSELRKIGYVPLEDRSDTADQ